jgi:hypothetical protein
VKTNSNEKNRDQMSDTKACARENMFSEQIIRSVDCFQLIKSKIEHIAAIVVPPVFAEYRRIVA